MTIAYIITFITLPNLDYNTIIRYNAIGILSTIGYRQCTDISTIYNTFNVYFKNNVFYINVNLY